MDRSTLYFTLISYFVLITSNSNYAYGQIKDYIHLDIWTTHVPMDGLHISQQMDYIYPNRWTKYISTHGLHISQQMDYIYLNRWTTYILTDELHISQQRAYMYLNRRGQICKKYRQAFVIEVLVTANSLFFYN